MTDNSPTRDFFSPVKIKSIKGRKRLGMTEKSQPKVKEVNLDIKTLQSKAISSASVKSLKFATTNFAVKPGKKPMRSSRGTAN